MFLHFESPIQIEVTSLVPRPVVTHGHSARFHVSVHRNCPHPRSTRSSQRKRRSASFDLYCFFLPRRPCTLKHCGSQSTTPSPSHSAVAALSLARSRSRSLSSADGPADLSLARSLGFLSLAGQKPGLLNSSSQALRFFSLLFSYLYLRKYPFCVFGAEACIASATLILVRVK